MDAAEALTTQFRGVLGDEWSMCNWGGAWRCDRNNIGVQPDLGRHDPRLVPESSECGEVSDCSAEDN